MAKPHLAKRGEGVLYGGMTVTNSPIATVFGGSGFIGSYVAAALAKAGYRVQVVSRNPEKAGWVKTASAAGQVVLRHGNIRDPLSVEQCIKGAEVVVNCVGLMSESGKQSFPALHAQAAERIAQVAASSGVKHLIHISALGVDKAARSKYARTKINGEKAVLAAFPAAIILRPSVVFGPEDHFFNLFAQMSRFSPLLPLIGGGKTQFQPVYVGDVADAVVAALEISKLRGKVIELGGPKTYTFREILQFIIQQTGRHCLMVPLPFPLAALKAALFELFPQPMLTVDQVKLLHYDNIVNPGQPGFKDLGLTPRSVEAVVPGYLSRYRRQHAAA